MAGTYTTVLGDAFDGIAFDLYGDEKYMKELIEANWRYCDVLVFSAGVVLDIPDIVETLDKSVPFWRQEDTAEEEEDEFYEYEEEEEEDDEDLTDPEADDADSEPDEDEGEDE